MVSDEVKGSSLCKHAQVFWFETRQSTQFSNVYSPAIDFSQLIFVSKMSLFFHRVLVCLAFVLCNDFKMCKFSMIIVEGHSWNFRNLVKTMFMLRVGY